MNNHPPKPLHYPPEPPQPPRRRTFAQAAAHYFKGRGRGALAMLVARYFPAAYIPFGIANDVTGIGVADNPITFGFIVYTLIQIWRHRNPQKFP